MKNTILLIFAFILIGFGIFLGIGIRTKSHIVEKSFTPTLTEARTEK